MTTPTQSTLHTSTFTYIQSTGAAAAVSTTTVGYYQAPAPSSPFRPAPMSAAAIAKAKAEAAALEAANGMPLLPLVILEEVGEGNASVLSPYVNEVRFHGAERVEGFHSTERTEGVDLNSQWGLQEVAN